MLIFKIKKGLNDYFCGVVVNEDGFTWKPYSEWTSSSPLGYWQTFTETTYNWFWFRVCFSRGIFNTQRHRISNDKK